jgi:hypothetical protein
MPSSAVRCVIYPYGNTPTVPAWFIRSWFGLQRCEEDKGFRTILFQKQNADWGRDPNKDAEPRFVPARIDIRADGLLVTLDGKQFRHVQFAEVLTRLRQDVETDPRLANYPFAQPVLGDGIGITLNDTELIVCNLRLKRLDP